MIGEFEERKEVESCAFSGECDLRLDVDVETVCNPLLRFGPSRRGSGWGGLA